LVDNGFIFFFLFDVTMNPIKLRELLKKIVEKNHERAFSAFFDHYHTLLIKLALPFVPKFDQSEEAVEVLDYLSYGLGLLSIAGIWINWKEKSYSKLFSILVLVFVVVVLYFGKEAGTTGGEIKHPEIRKGFVGGQGEG
jgi:hypothetical protein